MTANERRFHESVRHLGGRFPLEKGIHQPFSMTHKQKAWIEARILQLKELYLKMPDVHFDYIRNNSLNARAFQADGLNCIGINDYTMLFLMAAFSRMLADRKLFPEIGNANAELQNLPFYASVQGHVTFPDSEKERKALIGTRPQDMTRTMMAEYLAFVAIQFLFSHEYIHIAHGHLIFLQRRYGISAIAEVASRAEIPRIDPLTLQTLEMDADSAAVLEVMVFLSVIAENYTAGVAKQIRPDLDAVYRLTFTTPQTVAKYMFFAVFTLLRLLGDASFGKSDLVSATHPVPRLRQLMLIWAILRAGGWFNIPEFTDGEWLPMARQAEEALAVITDTPNRNQTFLRAVGQEPLAHYRDINRRWSEIQPELSQYAYKWIPGGTDEKADRLEAESWRIGPLGAGGRRPD